MKKVTIILSLLVISLAGFSQQQVDPETPISITMKVKDVNWFLELLFRSELKQEEYQKYRTLLLEPTQAQLSRLIPQQPKQDTTRKQPVVKDQPKKEGKP